MNQTAFLTNTRRTTTVEIDGQTFTVRKLRQGEVERMKRDYSTEDKALAGFRFVVAATVLDDDGTQMFTADDAAKLIDVDYQTIEGIATAAMTFSGLIKPAKNV